MEDFESAEIRTGETTIFARWSGSGSPVLLLHGFPQTHLMSRALDACPQLHGGVRRFARLRAQRLPGVDAGPCHFFPEEIPGETAEALQRFFG